MNKWLIRLAIIIFDIVIPIALLIYCFSDLNLLGFLGGLVMFPLGLLISLFIKSLIMEKLDEDEYV